MDADCKEIGRNWRLPTTSALEGADRFSMDPQRFDEILAEITKGYENIRSSFDNVNIAEILEEMATEWARAALASDAPPNFAEVAVVLQHCAALYGRKVDFLYKQALDVSDSMAAAAPAEGGDSGATPARGRRRRASGAARAPAGLAAFDRVQLTPCAAARRSASPPRPPPVLPRMYIELEPRALAPGDLPLTDLDGEPIGVPADYHVAWRLQDGYLVDELEQPRGGAGAALRGLSLVELEAALAARAPPSPPPPASPPRSPPPAPPLAASTPLPAPAPPAAPPPALDPPPDTPTSETEAHRAKRKRRSSIKIEDLTGCPLKLKISDEVCMWRRREFSPDAACVARVVAARARRVLDARLALAACAYIDFRGFEDEHPDSGGFPGWSSSEGAAAAALAARAGRRRSELDDEDDGFFERSSNSSFDSLRTASDIFALPDTPPSVATAAAAAGAAAANADAEAGGAAEDAAAPAEDEGGDAAVAADVAWSRGVAARAAAEEARGGPDVRALGAALLAALPRAAPLPVARLLARLARRPADVSRLLLTALFLANSGNVAISDSAPLAVGEFSLELLSADERLYAAAAAQDLAPAPAHSPP